MVPSQVQPDPKGHSAKRKAEAEEPEAKKPKVGEVALEHLERDEPVDPDVEAAAAQVIE